MKALTLAFFFALYPLAIAQNAVDPKNVIDPNTNLPIPTFELTTNTTTITNLQTRVIRVDVEAFNKLFSMEGIVAVHTAFRETIEKVTGATLDPPKSLFYNNRLGLIQVRANPKELDRIEALLDVLKLSRAKTATKP